MRRRVAIAVAVVATASILFLRWCNYSYDFLPRAKRVTTAAGTFLSAAPPHVPRTEAGGAIAAGRFYLVGGIDAFARTLTSFEMYEPITDQWTKLPDLPQPVNHPGVCAADGKVYVVGGFGPLGIRLRGAMLARWDPLAAVHVFDVDTRRWSAGPPLPEPRGAGGVAVAAGALWYVGGINQERGLARDLFRFDLAHGTWSRMAPMPTPRDHLRLEAVNARLFAIAGRRDDLRHNYAITERYDIATNRWSRVADAPSARGGLGSTVLNGHIYAFGGEHLWRCLDVVERYDPATDTWQKLGALPEARHGICAATLGGRIHLVSGGRHPRVSVSDIHRVFQPAHP